MAKKLVLSGVTLTDTSAPILYDDARLNAGSLLLFDMSHSLVTTVGVPSNGASIYNIAWQQAAAIIGSGDENSLAMAFTNTFAAGEGAFERTLKGALHGVVSQSAQNTHRAYVSGPSALVAYLAANPAREMALFAWPLVTKVAASTSNLYDLSIDNDASAAGNYLLKAAASNALGQQRMSLHAASGWTGAPNGSNSNNGCYAWAWGNVPPFNSLNPNDGRADVLYSCHLVDVAASEMTFSELDAADAAAYAAAFGAGGRFYGDTHTDPDTLLAA